MHLPKDENTVYPDICGLYKLKISNFQFLFAIKEFAFFLVLFTASLIIGIQAKSYFYLCSHHVRPGSIVPRVIIAFL
jgi:hypothetical protein